MKLLVLNLKLNFSLAEMIVYKKRLDEFITGDPEVIVCPQFPYLSLFNDGNYNLGAQNVSQYTKGAYTGEVSAKDLASLDVDYVIIGHSERRTIFNETETELITKTINSLNNNMSPIYCVGETKEERSRKKTLSVIQKQVATILNRISIDKIRKMVIAYEPVWAIGSGQTPTNQEIDEVLTFIKNFVLTNYKENIKVIYGGSINDFNIGTLNNLNSCDGFIIGNASLNINELQIIVKTCRTKRNKL